MVTEGSRRLPSRRNWSKESWKKRIDEAAFPTRRQAGRFPVGSCRFLSNRLDIDESRWNEGNEKMSIHHFLSLFSFRSLSSTFIFACCVVDVVAYIHSLVSLLSVAPSPPASWWRLHILKLDDSSQAEWKILIAVTSWWRTTCRQADRTHPRSMQENQRTRRRRRRRRRRWRKSFDWNCVSNESLRSNSPVFGVFVCFSTILVESAVSSRLFWQIETTATTKTTTTTWWKISNWNEGETKQKTD